MIKSKISTDHTYLVATNFWSPLDDNDNEEDKEDKTEINMIKSAATKTKQKSNKWTRRIARRREHKIIIDSGATSHFVSKDLNLPTEGASNC